LHIDFAKEAYQASNKRDYLEQMAVWFQRHEAIWLRESYLIWVEKQLESLLKARDISTMDEDGLEEDVQVKHVTVDMSRCDNNITHSGDTRAKLNVRYSLAKSPPHPNLTVEKLTEKFGTTNLLTALSSFLHHHLPGTSIMPSIHDRFDAFKQIVILLPTNQYLADRGTLVDRVRTSPSVDASG
jgi:hypothetical protein